MKTLDLDVLVHRKHMDNRITRVDSYIDAVCPPPKNGMTSPQQPWCKSFGDGIVDVDHAKNTWQSIERLLAMSLYSSYYIMGRVIVLDFHVWPHICMFTHQLCFQCKRSGHYYILQPWLIVHTLDKRKTKGSMTIQQNWQKTTRCPKFRLDYHWGLFLSFSSLSLD